ncbi:thiamine biosynthesis lipoprotein [Nitrosomonas cryotolerans]|nr:thiamine biosynthesis lipoprotein [Nitrosomonas cryotolerans]
MGTPCAIQLYAKTRSKAKCVADKAIGDVQRLEAIYSRYREDSFLSEINRTAALGGRISVDAETAGLLDYAAICYRESDGLFDITSGILRRAWNFKSAHLPSGEVIQSLRERVGWDKLSWISPILEFPMAGMEIDFGGIVKEYAVDRAAALCWEGGIQHGMVNLGGDIKIIGPHADGNPWRIGIRHPRQTNAVLLTLQLYTGALASSGDYERCIILNGMRYGHVLNPKTGWPVRQMASVSVVGDFCVVAGSASTIGMLKEEKGQSWLDELNLPHLWVDINGQTGGSLTSTASDNVYKV